MIRVARLAALVLAIAFVGLCLAPGLLRLANPTLYGDDVVRIVQLRTRTPGELLFRPFNEHMAPLFEVVTRAAWELGGGRIANAPTALVLASIVPFAATLLLLGRVIGRELGSPSTALAAVAILALASNDGEVVNWYSASSFAWASASALLAWLGALEACRARDARRRAGWLAVSWLGAISAPAFCAIGLLAGPWAASRLVLDDRASRRLRWLGALAPSMGTLAYLAACEWFRYRDILASGLKQTVGITTALWNIGRAPIDVLLPGLVGVGNLDAILPDALELTLAATSAVALLAWARSSRERRPMILGGLSLIVGGYAVTYGVRALPDPRQILNVQRYHLFPHLGLVLLIAPALRVGLRRLDGRPVPTLVAANALAIVLLWAHLPRMKEHLRFFRFPEQPPTIAALDRLEAMGRVRGITRWQILSALDPIRPGWVPTGFSALEMIGPTVASPALPDAEARRVLLASISGPDREALSGGMDASAYRVPSPSAGGPGGSSMASPGGDLASPPDRPGELSIGRMARLPGVSARPRLRRRPGDRPRRRPGRPRRRAPMGRRRRGLVAQPERLVAARCRPGLGRAARPAPALEEGGGPAAPRLLPRGRGRRLGDPEVPPMRPGSAGPGSSQLISWVRWVERSEAHARSMPVGAWASLRSTHPTKSGAVNQ